MSKCYFVTGTDTEVGKTVASCALLQAAKAAGYRTAGYKPVASGSEKTPKGLRNSDALALQRNSSLQLDYATVNPYTFAEPTSPHIISAQEGRPIEALVMSAGLRALEQQADWVLVEGDVTPPGKRHAEYMTTLTRMIPAPLLGEIPWLAENPENAATGKCINLALM